VCKRALLSRGLEGLIALFLVRWQFALMRLAVCLHRLAQRRKNALLVLRSVEAGLAQPHKKLSPAARNDEGGAARLQRFAQVAENIQAVDIDVANWNCVDDKPLQAGGRGIGRSQRTLLEIVGVEKRQRRVEAEEREARECLRRSMPLDRMKAG